MADVAPTGSPGPSRDALRCPPAGAQVMPSPPGPPGWGTPAVAEGGGDFFGSMESHGYGTLRVQRVMVPGRSVWVAHSGDEGPALWLGAGKGLTDKDKQSERGRTPPVVSSTGTEGDR